MEQWCCAGMISNIRYFSLWTIIFQSSCSDEQCCIPHCQNATGQGMFHVIKSLALLQSTTLPRMADDQRGGDLCKHSVPSRMLLMRPNQGLTHHLQHFLIIIIIIIIPTHHIGKLGYFLYQISFKLFRCSRKRESLGRQICTEEVKQKSSSPHTTTKSCPNCSFLPPFSF